MIQKSHQRKIALLMERDGGTCAYCGKPVVQRQDGEPRTPRTATIDHVQPSSRGGTDDPDNWVLACYACNHAKADKTPAAVSVSRSPYAKRFACLDCGAAVGMPNARCPECRKAHKAAYNRAYQVRYHARHRPPPAPLGQQGDDLPPIGMLVYDDDGGRIQCHVCGRFLGSLNTHIRTHGLDAARYKARYGLARGSSLLSPAAAEKQRQRAIERDQAARGIQFGEDGHSSPRVRGIENRQQSRIRSSVGSARHTQGDSGE